MREPFKIQFTARRRAKLMMEMFCSLTLVERRARWKLARLTITKLFMLNIVSSPHRARRLFSLAGGRVFIYWLVVFFLFSRVNVELTARGDVFLVPARFP